jgi:hypothetical protein
MIAVLADDTERSVVTEFFELFKTPWEFYHTGRQYEVLICSCSQLPQSSAQLVLVYGGEQTFFDVERNIDIRSQRSGVILEYKRGRIPIYGKCVTFAGSTIHALQNPDTQESAALEIASNGQRLVRIGFDLFQEIGHLLTRGQPKAHAATPTLDLHVAILRDLIISSSTPLIEIPPVPAGYSFIACLTHDVDHVRIRDHKWDHTMFGFLYRAVIGSLIDLCRGRKSGRHVAANWMAAFSLPLIHLGLAKDFWSGFDRYIEIEKGVTSTFFLIPNKGDSGQAADRHGPSKRAARYDISNIEDQVQRLLDARREIGLHGIDAWRDSAKGRTELERIRRVTGTSEVGVRMHWLFFDEQSPATLETAGFSYDSSIGYNETVGYRAGTSQVFKPLEVERMLELPMHVMDTALFFPAHMNLSTKQATAIVETLMENAIRFGGVLTVNWHDRSIAPERLWDDLYVKLLEDLKREGAWCPTANQAVSWFRKRRSAVIETSEREGETIRVKVSINLGDDALPGLRLRVHKAPAKTLLPEEPEAKDGFVDIAFNHSEQMQVAV